MDNNQLVANIGILLLMLLAIAYYKFRTWKKQNKVNEKWAEYRDY